jgi:hypothetical protein
VTSTKIDCERNGEFFLQTFLASSSIGIRS